MGKYAVTIEETFRKLIEFINSLTDEEADMNARQISPRSKRPYSIFYGRENN